MKNKLIIIGASGHGKVVLDIALCMGTWDEIYFLDDYSIDESILGFPIIGKSNEFLKFKRDAEFFVGIGNNSLRGKILGNLEREGAKIATLVHPKSIIGVDVSIGKGTAIMAGAIVNSSTKIGKGVILNTASTVDHDCVVGDFAHISPGVNIAGNVYVGEKSWLGIGSVVNNNVNIWDDIIIGSGSIVIKNIEKSGTYVGSPIKI